MLGRDDEDFIVFLQNGVSSYNLDLISRFAPYTRDDKFAMLQQSGQLDHLSLKHCRILNDQRDRDGFRMRIILRLQLLRFIIETDMEHIPDKQHRQNDPDYA